MTSASDNLATLVDGMLQDAGCRQDAELRDALLSLGSLAALPAPAPTGELAALLAAGVASPTAQPVPDEQHSPVQQPDEQPEDELARRRRRRHRPAALGLVLMAGMGLGVGGVAASSTSPGSNPIEHLVEEWVPWNNASGGSPTGRTGYRAPMVAADGELTDAASASASRASTDAGNLVSRLLRNAAGLPVCSGIKGQGAGPVKPDAGTGRGECAAGPAWSAANDNGAGGGQDGAGSAGAGGTPARTGAAGAGKAGTPGATPGGGAEVPGAAGEKAAGSAGAAVQVPAEGQYQGTQSQGTQSQGTGQGNGQKPAPPAK